MNKSEGIENNQKKRVQIHTYMDYQDGTIHQADFVNVLDRKKKKMKHNLSPITPKSARNKKFNHFNLKI